MLFIIHFQNGVQAGRCTATGSGRLFANILLLLFGPALLPSVVARLISWLLDKA
jgi:hypothetical protein